MPQDPLQILREYDHRARSNAPGLPRLEKVREIWLGIGFRVAGEYLALPIDEVRELLPYPRLTRIPGTKPWIKGLANVRGRLVTVVDLAGFLMNRATRIPARSRVISIRDEIFPVAFLVDEVAGQRHFMLDTLTEDVSARPDWIRGYLKGTLKHGDVEWGALDLTRLLRDPAFVDVVA